MDDNIIVTTDNSGGIGEKEQDIVSATDRLTAYYSARVTLLEQWAARAEPFTTLIHNFSGHASWAKYVQGVEDLFQEAGVPCPQISGSTETNMELVQSAIAVTMIGKREERVSMPDGQWFTYGTPLVGEEVLANADEVASIRRIRQALDHQIINRVWPVGSQGILYEVRRVMNDDDLKVESELDIRKTAGPSTVVLVELPLEKRVAAEKLFGNLLREIDFE
ncbi:alpha-ribazole-5-phosphate synthase [Sporosarcina pasteurii]|uniref:alpha-ribazole-5-phosphate synthase n=1 Tax=Sporosarcina pasteurii TaxID=1474 RepID=UPI001FB92739|nr:alpha-ribazole-5-phosphate synthase [Sporosarcina pasteurii]MDS9472307.1 alpha-ribazole-5-phosphate synthase [Sporosarcina pasteurii]